VDVESVRTDLGFDGGNFGFAGIGCMTMIMTRSLSGTKSKTGGPGGPPASIR
jgi:hypothetical protein